MNTHKIESLAINFAGWNDHHTELTDWCFNRINRLKVSHISVQIDC